jgi:hypothetical protein
MQRGRKLFIGHFAKPSVALIETMPVVSIIIPLRNKRRYIRETLETCRLGFFGLGSLGHRKPRNRKRLSSSR